MHASLVLHEGAAPSNYCAEVVRVSSVLLHVRPKEGTLEREAAGTGEPACRPRTS